MMPKKVLLALSVSSLNTIAPLRSRLKICRPVARGLMVIVTESLLPLPSAAVAVTVTVWVVVRSFTVVSLPEALMAA